MTANSVIIAKSQIALLHEEIEDRLREAQGSLLDLAAQASGDDLDRLLSKIKGVMFVAGSHIEQIKLYQAPSEVRRHCAELEDRIHTGGWDRGFVQGVDLALSYIRGYVS